MKFSALFAGACLFFAPMSLISCSSDLPDNPNQDTELVPVNFDLSFSKLSGVPESTRTLAPDYKYADGKSISVLKAYVYNQANGASAAPVKVVDIDIKNINENREGDVTILLPKGQCYDVIFIGTSIPQTTASAKLYYNSTDRSLTVNYGSVAGNDEELDCFFAAQKDVTTETVLENAVELKRPFAQLNIGTQDYASYNGITPIKNIAVSVDGIYNKFSLMDGEVTGEPMKVNFSASPVPTGQTYPVSGFDYLSMNYLLVNHRKLVDVTMTVNHINSTNAANIIEIENVAVERNYQTNLYGLQILSGVISQ